MRITYHLAKFTSHSSKQNHRVFKNLSFEFIANHRIFITFVIGKFINFNGAYQHNSLSFFIVGIIEIHHIVAPCKFYRKSCRTSQFTDTGTRNEHRRYVIYIEDGHRHAQQIGTPLHRRRYQFIDTNCTALCIHFSPSYLSLSVASFSSRQFTELVPNDAHLLLFSTQYFHQFFTDFSPHFYRTTSLFSALISHKI